MKHMGFKIIGDRTFPKTRYLEIENQWQKLACIRNNLSLS